jgi:hypothetical protein
MESGKAWAKCSYCNESLDGEPLRLNPNPDARKPAICIPCFDGMRDIPETDGEGTGIADGKTSEFMEELVRTGREGMEGIDTPEHREVLGVIKDVLEAVNRGRERGSFHLFPRSRSIFGRWGLVYSIEDDGKYGGSLLTIGMSSGNHYPVVVQVQGEWTANAADLVELEGKLIEAFQTESVRTWLYWKNHLMEGRK